MSENPIIVSAVLSDFNLRSYLISVTSKDITVRYFIIKKVTVIFYMIFIDYCAWWGHQ